MKILHTADWHLGKLLKEFSRLDDQAQALDQLLQLAATEQPDVVVLAGDIYDRAVPPAEAVALFDRMVAQLVGQMGIPLLAIAGNHDNPERVQYGASLFAHQKFHVAGTLTWPWQPVVIADAHGPVYFYLLPYTEPETLSFWLRQAQEAELIAENQATEWLASLKTHQQVMNWAVAQIAAQRQPGERTVLVAHAFVQGGETSESERDLLVGGAEHVAPATFAGLSYVALGHLHKPQQFLDGRVRYSGSLLKYSRSEARHQKSATVAELDAAGGLHLRVCPLPPARELWEVEATLTPQGLALAPGQPPVQPDDYLYVQLQNPSPLTNAMSRIQKDYPHTIGLNWAKSPQNTSGATRLTTEQVRQATELELVQQFYQEMENQPLSPEQTRILQAEITTIKRNL
jgi:DNA repair protein SbcD/Mre11